MNEIQRKSVDILSETVGVMRELVELSRKKRDRFTKGRVAPVLALQENEESLLVRLSSLLVEVDQMSSGGSLPMPALDDPERAWERMAEIKLALPRLAAELRELTHVNRGLLFSTMRYVNALLGALGSTSGYKENGVIVLQEGPRSNVCGDA